jgi:hypothetical protein
MPPVDGLRRLWALFNRVMGRIGQFMSAIVLTVVYFSVLWPFALLAGRWDVGWKDQPALDLDRPF